MTQIDTLGSGVSGEDLYPEDDTAQAAIVKQVQQKFIAAKTDKSAHQEKNLKYYKMYRSWVKKRAKGDWRSHLWLPVAFYVIETITPRLVAQLPKFTVEAQGPEDAAGAETMEGLLDWASDKSDLYLELVKAIKSSLLYGTGILKTGFLEKTAFAITREQEMEEVTGEVPIGLDINGDPMTETMSMGVQPTGNFVVTRTPYTSYAGPVAEAVDIDDFFIDPFASSVEDARYVIHRVYRDKSHIEKMFEDGVYKKPSDEVWQDFVTDHSMKARQLEVDLGSMNSQDREDGLYQIYETWTDNVIVTTCGSEGGQVLLRAERNPFAHGEKPFVRIVDHLVPHEFWGIGELEPLEGLQDVINSTWNNRLDNVKLIINTMLRVVMDYVEDPSDLQVGPGRIIKLREGIPADQAVSPFTLPDVTADAYNETAEAERMAEKVSGVNPYMTGAESPAYNRTATGVALVSEQGNTRMSHKVRIAELTGFKRLGRHYGSLLQQYIPDEMVVRILGPEGQMVWDTITPDSIAGRFDYDIEAESSTQTESIRKEQTLSLFQMLAADPFVNPLKPREDLLKVMGRKDVQNWLLTPEQLMAMQQPQEEPGAEAETAPPV